MWKILFMGIMAIGVAMKRLATASAVCTDNANLKDPVSNDSRYT
jgi:hypothetical protein